MPYRQSMCIPALEGTFDFNIEAKSRRGGVEEVSYTRYRKQNELMGIRSKRHHYMLN